MIPITQDSKIDILYKKYLGLPSTGQNNPINIEPRIDSTKRIFSQNYLFVQPIPKINLPLSNYVFEENLGPTTAVYYNSNYPYIKYISTLTLSNATFANNIAYSSPYLSNVITNIYDPSYNYYVFNNNKSQILYGLKPDNNSIPFLNLEEYIILDPDSGILRFYTTVSNVNYLSPPVISFYCYRGQIGSDSTFLRIQMM